MTSRERVVVTGLGAITPLGNTVADYWAGLVAGRSGIGPVTLFDASQHDCRIAGEVKDFDPCAYLERRDAKRMDRFAQFGVCASLQAVADAGLQITAANASQVGVMLGTGTGGLKMMEEQEQVLLTKGPGRCSPFTVPMMICNMAAGLTAIHTGAKGPNSCPVTACAAGANAIGDALRLLQQGYVQAMICGGTVGRLRRWGWRLLRRVRQFPCGMRNRPGLPVPLTVTGMGLCWGKGQGCWFWKPSAMPSGGGPGFMRNWWGTVPPAMRTTLRHQRRRGREPSVPSNSPSRMGISAPTR